MAVSCRAISARSAAGKSSRASFATFWTWSMSIGELRGARLASEAYPSLASRAPRFGLLNLRGGEWLALEWPLHFAGPDALDAHAGPDRLAFLDHADALEVRVEGPPAGAGDLLADSAEVLGL